MSFFYLVLMKSFYLSKKVAMLLVCMLSSMCVVAQVQRSNEELLCSDSNCDVLASYSCINPESLLKEYYLNLRIISKTPWEVHQGDVLKILSDDIQLENLTSLTDLKVDELDAILVKGKSRSGYIGTISYKVSTEMFKLLSMTEIHSFLIHVGNDVFLIQPKKYEMYNITKHAKISFKNQLQEVERNEVPTNVGSFASFMFAYAPLFRIESQLSSLPFASVMNGFSFSGSYGYQFSDIAPLGIEIGLDATYQAAKYERIASFTLPMKFVAMLRPSITSDFMVQLSHGFYHKVNGMWIYDKSYDLGVTHTEFISRDVYDDFEDVRKYQFGTESSIKFVYKHICFGLTYRIDFLNHRLFGGNTQELRIGFGAGF